MADNDKCFKLIQKLSDKVKSIESENRNLKAEIKRLGITIRGNTRKIQSNYGIAHQNSLNVIPITRRLRKLEEKR